MFSTEEIYNEAVKDSRIHYGDTVKKEKNAFLVKFSIFTLLLSAGYAGFYYYNSLQVDESLIVTKNYALQVQNSSEVEYTNALESIENELMLREGKTVSQNEVLDTSDYIAQLEKEIGNIQLASKQEPSQRYQSVVIQKGDTLRSLASKYYGNSQEYGRIIASNATLTQNNHTIYEGQKILLPY